MKKLKLNALKIESFVTSMNNINKKTIVGGILDTTPINSWDFCETEQGGLTSCPSIADPNGGWHCFPPAPAPAPVPRTVRTIDQW